MSLVKQHPTELSYHANYDFYNNYGLLVVGLFGVSQMCVYEMYKGEPLVDDDGKPIWHLIEHVQQITPIVENVESRLDIFVS